MNPKNTRPTDAHAVLALAGAAVAAVAGTDAPPAAVQPAPPPKRPKAKDAHHTPAYAVEKPNPHIHRDEFDGQGGNFAIVDGKRVRCDDEGNPLPPTGDAA